MPNIWVCRTGGSDIEALRRRKFAGFQLHRANPLKFNSEEALKAAILADLANETKDKNYSGATFARQIWQISHEVSVGDWIYIDHPNIAAKPRDRSLKPGERGKQRTFIIAAGVVKEAYKYDSKNWHCHRVGVDWKWQGEALIDYGFQSQIFVHIDSRHPKVLADLTAIWPGLAKPAQIVGGETYAKDANTPESIDEEWTEGQVVLKTHREIERSKEAKDAAKRHARTTGGGKISCAACGMLPVDVFGAEIIDAHHVVPLKELRGKGTNTGIDSFRMLCPTCHRAVHYVLSQGKHEGLAAIEAVKAMATRQQR